MRLLLALVLSVGLLAAEEPVRFSRNYRMSVAALLAAHSADTVTSWGCHEGNPLLGDRFRYQGLAVKSALVGTTLGAQYLLTRHHPERARSMALINWAVAGGIGFIAWHNTRIH